jgi:NADH:ubiquinone oxidoreductase subunit F (NADH-binding)
LRRTGKKTKKTEKHDGLSSFQVKRTALKRLVKQLDGAVQCNKSITAHIVGGELIAKVTGIEIAALGDFDSEQKVSAFVGKAVKLVEES